MTASRPAPELAGDASWDERVSGGGASLRLRLRLAVPRRMADKVGGAKEGGPRSQGRARGKVDPAWSGACTRATRRVAGWVSSSQTLGQSRALAKIK